MPKEPNTSEQLDQLRRGDPSQQSLAKQIDDYMNDRDSSIIQSLPSKLKWNQGSLVNTAGKEFHFDPAAAAIAEIFILLVKAGQFDHDWVDRFSLYGITSYWSESLGNSESLITIADQLELSRYDFAFFLLTKKGHCLSFGWQKRNDETPFGSAYDCRFFDWEIQTPGELNPLESMIWELSDSELVAIQKRHLYCVPNSYGNKEWNLGNLQGLMALTRPEPLIEFLSSIKDAESASKSVNWQYVLTATDAFDVEALRYAELTSCGERQLLLIFLASLRPEKHLKRARSAALEDSPETISHSVAFLADHYPEDLCARLQELIENQTLTRQHFPEFILVNAFTAAAENQTKCGQKVFDQVAATPYTGGFHTYSEGRSSLYSYALHGLLAAESPQNAEILANWLSRIQTHIDQSKADKKEKSALALMLWLIIRDTRPEFFIPQLWELVQNKSKTLRTIAVAALQKALGETASEKACELLTAKKLESRLGAAELLAANQDNSGIPAIQSALENETSDKVRSALQQTLDSLGVTPDVPTPSKQSIDELEAIFAKQAKRLKLPKGDWLSLAKPPPLKGKTGEPLSEAALTFLIAKQSKHKTITAAPDILPLLAHLDRAQTTDFALTLFEQWLASDQAAADRWVLTLTGLLGDTRAIPVLTAPIKSWAENSRHKMAEYAAQAIALIPGDEALMILDSLSNRYRSKFKNIGRACRASLVQAAKDRGVSLDELADLIVPTLDFDDENQRPLPDTNVQVVLQPDFKLTFYNPDTEKETKSPPSNLPDTAKKDIQLLRKLIRETVKGQTARLELSLVRQRRWPTKRWQELFEKNPILQSFASRLVWATFSKEGALLKIFRRYPNGLLATASGDLVEFTSDDESIGMVHPLELPKEDVEAWQQHLDRMKVKPPFPQLNRPTALLDPLHKNRKQLSTAEKKEISCGTFRSRAEKRGWQRGSVVDAGGISAYYKDFPGAGIEVFLEIEEMWVGQDAMDSITLGVAHFVKAGSVTTGSYTYDEPTSTDDPRVLAFGDIPPIVYSETLTDLEAITA